MNDKFIITPDRVLELAKNFISRHGVKIDLSPKNNIFFIKTDYINEFATAILPKINYKFILLTHDSDFSIPGNTNILENPFLIKWFGMNVHSLHPKLQAMPIGMANEVWPHGNKQTMVKIINENNQKTNLVYCNFDPNTNPEQRYNAMKKLRQLPFIDFDFVKHDYESYLRKVSTYKYIISPPGNSVDCHRIWESMYLKTIPICLKSIPLHYFKSEPILFLDDWGQLSRDLIDEKYELLMQRATILSDLQYYIRQINELLENS